MEKEVKIKKDNKEKKLTKTQIKELEEKTRMQDFERNYQESFEYVCGLDEAGRGPLAGPVVVAAVIMPKDCDTLGIRDSKKISEKKREKLFEEIKEKAIAYKIVCIDEKTIDDINILEATKLGAKMAIEGLEVKPNIAIVDALKGLDTKIPVVSIIKGDDKSYSIAASSILAKVHRDRIMREYAKQYPEYGFERNKGYGTKEHMDQIREKGLCKVHRRSFVRGICNEE